MLHRLRPAGPAILLLLLACAEGSADDASRPADGPAVAPLPAQDAGAPARGGAAATSAGGRAGDDATRWRARPAPALAGTPDDPTLAVEGLLNGGFELLADSSTAPPKYGAYWPGAFSPREGEADDLVEDVPDAAEGARVLRLRPGAGRVTQKLVLDPRWTGDVEVVLSWRSRGAATLAVTLEDGPGRRVERLLAPPPDAARDGEAAAWARVTLPLGADFAQEHGARPVPRLVLGLEARASGDDAADAEAFVEVDAASAPVRMPAVSAEALSDAIRALVAWQLDLFLLPRAQGGLGLVDPATGYVTADSYDVDTGDDVSPTRSVSFHSVHTLLVLWLREARARGWTDEVARYTPHLRRIVTTLLERHFHPETGLPFVRRLSDGQPLAEQPQTVGAFVEFLLDASELVDDEALARRCVAQARRIADTLVRLQREHDQDPQRVHNVAKLDERTGVFEGTYPNWYGHIPNRLTPTGEIETPRQFNTAWAIVKRRSFWYHLFKSPRAVLLAHERVPREGDLPALHRALSLYHRDWDAARYDLENDTDDHYGYLCEDLLDMLRHSDGTLVDALALVQEATDHRLSRETGRVDDTIWIQAVRLGTACAGDSPRAFKGVLDLWELPPAINPATSGLPLYRDAILELAANDFKGRQLTNAEFTESFFKLWEMVCICFRGTYQGDCRERPLSEWHGDVGDIFGGPPRSSIEAQAWAYTVAGGEQRPEILARLATLMHVTESSLRRPFGYLYGLDPDVARQYELPEKYVIGLDHHTTTGLAYTMSWMLALPRLRDG